MTFRPVRTVSAYVPILIPRMTIFTMVFLHLGFIDFLGKRPFSQIMEKCMMRFFMIVRVICMSLIVEMAIIANLMPFLSRASRKKHVASLKACSCEAVTCRIIWAIRSRRWHNVILLSVPIAPSLGQLQFKNKALHHLGRKT